MLRPIRLVFPALPPRDPRTAHWLGAGNWTMLAALLGSFVFTVKVFLPRFMRDRKPFQLTNVIRVYNLVLVAINAYFLSRLAPLTYIGGGGYNLLCQGVDVLFRDERTLRIISLTYYYSMVRIVEFMDTIFFVLRKKFNQASTLNVSHHCISVALPWWGLAYGIDGQVMLLVLVNMAIHVVMYFYYFLSSFGPCVHKYLFWKKYLTRVQIVQFILTAVHMSIPLIVDCGYPKMTSLVTLVSMFYFIVMFGHFYRKAYHRRDETRPDKKALRESAATAAAAAKPAAHGHGDGHTMLDDPNGGLRRRPTEQHTNSHVVSSLLNSDQSQTIF